MFFNCACDLVALVVCIYFRNLNVNIVLVVAAITYLLSRFFDISNVTIFSGEKIFPFVIEFMTEMEERITNIRMEE